MNTNFQNQNDQPVSHKMSYFSGKYRKTSEYHYRASRRAMLIYGNAVTNYLKKYFWSQKSDKTTGFGSEIA